MTKPRQLTPQDVVFVGGETDKVYQHTGGLTLLDGRDRPGFGFDSLRRHLEERIAGIPHFRWKLHEVPFGLDLPYWVEDEEFSFDHHIRRIAVPSPGDREALAELAAYLYSRHMDRTRPLWEIWLIEGLADGQVAMFTKLHHCMMDGEGATQLGAIMTDFEPDAPPRPIAPAVAEARPGPVPAPWQESLQTAWHLSRMPWNAGRELLGAARTSLAQWLSSGLRSEPVPVAPFNADIGSERGFVFGSLSLADVKAVKNHFDVTVNDVVLALVGGSLRRYLLERGDLPAEALRTSIAVSLRAEGDDQFSNRVTTATVTLATDLADPVRRLRVIAEDTVQAKEQARAGAMGMLELMSMFPPVMVNAMMRAVPPDVSTKFTGFNLLVSNVRGAPLPMYIGGARTSAMYPMSILMPGSGINVTCISYLDRFEFGLTIEPKLFPDPWLLIDGLREALEDYLKVIRQSTRLEPEADPAHGAVIGLDPAPEAHAHAGEKTENEKTEKKSRNGSKPKGKKKRKKKKRSDPAA